jgi:DNA/RNA-binding domain of Phe-tRNA-synthetase-like protein
MERSEVLVATDAWKIAFPGAVVGALVMRGVHNPEQSAALEVHMRQLEEDVRTREGIGSDPVMRAYADYYRSHGKTYHLKSQWESVAIKGKPIPRRAALVEAMFMAELKNLILTAGHDLTAVAPPVEVAATSDDDRYVAMNGVERALRRDDMMMRDRQGIISSVLQGPDQRTRITAETREVLFAAYAPAGVGERAVRDHLEDIRANVLCVAPGAKTELVSALSAA